MTRLRSPSRLLARLAIPTLALLASVTPALASGSVPRTPSLTRTQPIWIGFMLMALMLAGTIAISLMPSKRSHQD